MKCTSVTQCVRGIFGFLEQSTDRENFDNIGGEFFIFQRKFVGDNWKRLRKLQVSVKWRWILWKVISSSSSFTSERINEKKWPRRGGFFLPNGPEGKVVGRPFAYCLGAKFICLVFRLKKNEKLFILPKYFFPIMWIYHSASESTWISKDSRLFGSTDGVGGGYFVWHFI